MRWVTKWLWTRLWPMLPRGRSSRSKRATTPVTDATTVSTSLCSQRNFRHKGHEGHEGTCATLACPLEPRQGPRKWFLRQLMKEPSDMVYEVMNPLQLTLARALSDLSLRLPGESLLFSIPDFDPVRQIQPESMHFLFLGIFKRMMQLTFEFGDNPWPEGPLRRLPIGNVSLRLEQVKVPSEVRPYTRPLCQCFKAPPL